MSKTKLIDIFKKFAENGLITNDEWQEVSIYGKYEVDTDTTIKIKTCYPYDVKRSLIFSSIVDALNVQEETNKIVANIESPTKFIIPEYALNIYKMYFLQEMTDLDFNTTTDSTGDSIVDRDLVTSMFEDILMPNKIDDDGENTFDFLHNNTTLFDHLLGLDGRLSSQFYNSEEELLELVKVYNQEIQYTNDVANVITGFFGDMSNQIPTEESMNDLVTKMNDIVKDPEKKQLIEDMKEINNKAKKVDEK